MIKNPLSGNSERELTTMLHNLLWIKRFYRINGCAILSKSSISLFTSLPSCIALLIKKGLYKISPRVKRAPYYGGKKKKGIGD